MHISIAMCTYNGARFLTQQLTSIRSQTLRPDELVVCDDGSSDETIQILEAFSGVAPFAVRLIRNEQNLGPVKNFEQAISLCNGELIALSDQDDFWYPEKLSHLSRILDADSSLGAVFSDATLMDADSRPLSDRLWQRIHYQMRDESVHVERSLMDSLLQHDVVTGATLMFRADLRDILLPIPPGWFHDGWIAWMLTLYSGIGAIEEPLIAYRLHGTQHAGLPPDSLTARIGRARSLGHAECIATIQQFEELRRHWLQRPGAQFETRLKAIEGKIDHLRHRIDLPGGLMQRIRSVLAARDDYRRYTNGMVSMFKDILLL